MSEFTRSRRDPSMRSVRVQGFVAFVAHDPTADNWDWWCMRDSVLRNHSGVGRGLESAKGTALTQAEAEDAARAALLKLLQPPAAASRVRVQGVPAQNLGAVLVCTDRGWRKGTLITSSTWLRPREIIEILRIEVRCRDVYQGPNRSRTKYRLKSFPPDVVEVVI